MEKSTGCDKGGNIKKIFRGRCFDCKVCNGIACAGILPGMGGLGTGATFQANYNSWEHIKVKETDNQKRPLIGVAPMTGVSENIGGHISERDFQHALSEASASKGFFYCGGDGSPDFKLHYSIEAGEKYNTSYFFIKPYSNVEIIRRMRYIKKAQGVGIDIDSYNLVNLIGKAELFNKTAQDLLGIKKQIPFSRFVIKGIYNKEQLDIVRKVRPFAVVVSNHGGRVFDNGEGTAYILERLEPLLRPYVEEIWVDGGIRTVSHIRKAAALGADRVLIGRPFAVNAVKDKNRGVRKYIEKDLSII